MYGKTDSNQRSSEMPCWLLNRGFLCRLVVGSVFLHCLIFYLLQHIFCVKPQPEVLDTHRPETTKSTSMEDKDVIQWPKIILYGDSITQYSFGPVGGWGALIADKLVRKCDIINRGFSGYNANWNLIAISRVISRADAPHTAAVVIFLGANDSNGSGDGQHVPVNEYREKLVKMVQYLESIGISHKKVIFVGPPAFDGDKLLRTKGRKLTKDNTVMLQYSQACQQAASEAGAQFVDLYNAMIKEKDWSELLSDGLHLSQSGARLLYKLLSSHIKELTQHLTKILPRPNRVGGTTTLIQWLDKNDNDKHLR